MRSPRSRAAHLDRWRKSAQFRQIARESAKANLAAFDAAPRCGAKRKRDGKPCENPAMKNGRCPLHGGKTPSGDQWHVVQYSDCSTSHGAAKFNRKLLDHQRYAKKRAARLARMTPDERAKHDAWHQSHKPGSAARRSAAQLRAAQNAEAKRILAQEPHQTPPSPELARVKAALAAARAELARVEARINQTCSDEGVFS
ncbi:MAG: HGGxSTG domain-containing protein [Xanthobacteraceae bacterium]